MRRFQRTSFDRLATNVIRPNMETGELLFRYTIAVPLFEIKPRNRKLADQKLIDTIEQMLIAHFSGYTSLPNSPGTGLRDPGNLATIELNLNAFYYVYATRCRESDEYFRILREKLESALDEGVILIERQEVTLM